MLVLIHKNNIKKLFGLILAIVLVTQNIGSAAFAATGVLDTSQVVPVFDSKFGGTSGNGDGQINGPIGIALDNQDNIFLADSLVDRIQKFDKNGNFLLKFGSNGTNDGQFTYPTDLADDSNNNLYVVDSQNQRVQKFDDNGNFILKFGSAGSNDGQFTNPLGIAIDKQNNVYVSDTSLHNVQKFDSSGNFLLKFGSFGTGDGQFNSPNSLNIDNDGNILVAEDSGNRIQKFDPSGNFISKFGSAGSGDGQFNQPYAVHHSDKGNIYVSDLGNNRIQVFDSAGTYLGQFGTAGAGDGQFNGPYETDFDSEGNFYVADSGNNRVQKFRFQKNLGTVPNEKDSKVIDLSLKVGNDITKYESIDPAPPSDDFDLPMGVIDFSFIPSDSKSGKEDVSLFFETDLPPELLSPVLYFNGNFSPLTEATLTATTQNGKQGILLTFPHKTLNRQPVNLAVGFTIDVKKLEEFLISQGLLLAKTGNSQILTILMGSITLLAISGALSTRKYILKDK